MASSGAQLCGFLLSLIGMATTLAASLMVEWEELVSLSSTRIHAGLWMKCSTTKDSFCCEYHDSLIGLEGELLLLLLSLSQMSHFLIKCFWKLFFLTFLPSSLHVLDLQKYFSCVCCFYPPFEHRQQFNSLFSFVTFLQLTAHNPCFQYVLHRQVLRLNLIIKSSSVWLFLKTVAKPSVFIDKSPLCFKVWWCSHSSHSPLSL